MLRVGVSRWVRVSRLVRVITWLAKSLYLLKR